MGVAKKAPHPNCAYLWMKYVTTPKVEAQQALGCMPPPRNWRGRLKGLLGLRLGSLMQYRSRPLVLPAWYSAAPLPDRPPVISIVTPSFLQGRFLERTLQTVQKGRARLQVAVEPLVPDGHVAGAEGQGGEFFDQDGT